MGNHNHSSTIDGLEAFLVSLDSQADVFVFSRKSKSSSRVANLVRVHGHRYILFSPPTSGRYSSEWNDLIIGGAPRFFFLRFVVYHLAVKHFLSRGFTHVVLADLNDIIFQLEAPSGQDDESVLLVSLSQYLSGRQRNRLLPSFEFNSWISDSPSAKINAMWLGGCATIFKENENHLPLSILSIYQKLEQYVNSSVCTGNDWGECDASSFFEKSLPNMFVSCAGSTIGGREGIAKYLQYFGDMHKENIVCNDQGIHNLVLNFGLDVSDLVISTPSSGVVLTMDSLDDSTLATKGMVVGPKSGAPFRMIHQYNRCGRIKSGACRAVALRLAELKRKVAVASA